MEGLKQAVRKINSGLFSYIEVIQHPDEKDEGSSIFEIKRKEAGQKSAQAPFKLGTSVSCKLQSNQFTTFENRKIPGLTRSLKGSVTTSNLFNPEDNLSAKLEYVLKDQDSVFNPENLIYKTSFFSSSKLSPVFTAGPGFDEVVPPISVNRVGLKTNLTQNFIGQSKLRYGLGLEGIKTRDANKKISANGHMLFHHADITRDTTRLLNGATVGERTVLQVDQGLGLGRNFSALQRHQLTLTRFIQLKQVEEGSGKPQPPVLVLHGHYGSCIGDLPSYDAFLLGGPYSVRGYKMGELGAARSILELGAELRVPVKSAHVYAFAEHGNDLGSSKDVEGNPTAVYGKTGRGSSYGLGVKLGGVRAEYAVNHNSGTGALFLRLGERY